MASSVSTVKPENRGHWHDPAGPAVYGTDLRDGKQADGKERRVEIPYNDPIPYRWICKIKIFDEVANDSVEVPPSCPCKDCKSEEPQFKGHKYTPKSSSAPRYGTGFLINIPQSTRCILLTAAHNLAFRAKNSTLLDSKDDEEQENNSQDKTHILYASRVVVSFPGREPIFIKKREFFFPPRYTCHHIDEWTRSNYDYGVIVLPGTRHPNQPCGFGFSATMTDRELLGGISLSIFGYPMLKDDEMKESNVITEPTQSGKPPTSVPPSDNKPKLNPRDDRVLYGSGGRVQSVGPRIIRYFVNTSEGQSGCPVYLWDEGYYTVVGIHVQYERLGEYTINAASRIRVGMLQNILAWLHKYDVNEFRPKNASSSTGPEETQERTAQDFWYPFWHVGLSSQKASGDNSPKILNISRPATRDPTVVQPITYDPLCPTPEAAQQPLKELVETFTDDNPGALIGILPVKTFSEGHRVSFQDNLWVLSSMKYDDTFVSFDSHHEEFEKRISVSSRYRNTPILHRALELVTMFMMPAASRDSPRQWQIIPVRYPTVIYQPDRLKNPVERRKFDEHFAGFDFQRVTITKVGDEATPIVVEVPNAEVNILGLAALGLGLVGLELMQSLLEDKREQGSKEEEDK